MHRDAYGDRLLAAYDVAFPQAVVSVTTTSAPTEVAWDVDDAAAAARINLSVPTLDRALGRVGRAAERAGLCIPHLLADVSQDGRRRASPRLLAAVRSGAKLSAGQKAELAQLTDKPLRVALTAAYAANRCRGEAYARACVPVFLKLGDQGHANLLVLAWAEGTLEAALYEPNGAAAAEEYGTVDAYFATFADDVGSYLMEPRRVTFRVVGQGFQTALGETSRTRRGMTVITRHRGYPVCEAVVLYVMHRYMAQGPAVDLAAFEGDLLEDLAASRAGLLKFVEDLAAWVRRSYASAAAARLRAIFRNSNVVACDLRYGAIAVTVELATESFA